MKTVVSILGSILLIAGFAANAGAAPYTFDMGADSVVDTSGTADVLEMYANVNQNLDDLIFSLDDGESKSFYFATIGTTEGWIDKDDIRPGTVSAILDFDIPDLIGVVDGKSIGFSAAWHFLQGWNLVWDDPVIIDMGDAGEFTIELSDVGYASWCWKGPDGSADITAKITYNPSGAPVAPVPEPSTILLMGVGLVGFATFGRKRLGRM
ncbi:MAG: PEP-CTERM sorting domain-containing protein [Thermodesulfobacteriota bacterium]|nr:PEP-CTERM sorting domain-containing protein [Thermodesulfobacteriota bacterium]